VQRPLINSAEITEAVLDVTVTEFTGTENRWRHIREEVDRMTLGSLFDGSGGFPLAGMLAGIEPVWNSEIEPFAVRVTEKRMPTVRHYGNISEMNGADIPPVDIITFGSPCQDMSIAGKRSGLGGERSGLFHEAIRIIKEMRCKTNGEYPKYIVWENVCGAFSSNGGDDFRCVLEEICRVKAPEISVPSPKKWEHAGLILGDSYSVAWRTMDAQYWGVPQRRKRIFLVADFDGKCAGKILFKSEGLSGYTSESFRAWQRTADSSESRTDTTGLYVCDGKGRKIDVLHFSEGLADQSDEVQSDVQLFENHSQDTRYTGPLNVAPTVLAAYGTGGNNHPFVVNTYDVRFTSEGTKNVRANCYETDTARTLDTSGNAPDSNQGGVAVVYSASKASFFTRTSAEKAETLCATDYKDPPLVASHSFYPQMKAESQCLCTEVSNTLVNGTNPGYQNGIVSEYADRTYTVRRITPQECARLQGFPDWWCSGLASEEPSEEEIDRWVQLFDEYQKTVKPGTKPRSRNQVIKWLKEPYTDSAEYKLWGNGVALPCVYFVMSGIAYYSQN